MMLRRRSASVSSKQGLMSYATPLTSPTAASLFKSPGIFVGFSAKASPDSEAAMSPTSILETKPFSTTRNPFFSDTSSGKSLLVGSSASTSANECWRQPWDNGESRAIGLGLVDVLTNEDSDTRASKPASKVVVFGSQLKVQIPSVEGTSVISPTGSVEYPHSPIEFGIKTKDSQLALNSPARRSPLRSGNLSSDMTVSSPRVFTACLPTSEMELSEDYTCVISHGPNPRTIHIFDNCVIEHCGDRFITPVSESQSPSHHSGYAPDDFLSFCYACKKNLGQGKDIFMYRGEKAFCSHECRYQEMLYDEGREKC